MIYKAPPEYRNTEVSEPAPVKKDGKKRPGVLPKILFFFFLAVFVFSTYKVGCYFLDYRHATEVYDSLKDSAAERQPASSQGGTAETEPAETAAAIDFDYLKMVNPDIVGWITCEGTTIDYPVLRGDDNAYYLKHLYNGESSNGGSIFMDYRSGEAFQDKNTVLYGHLMTTDSMFHALANYKDPSFYAEHPTMKLYTPYGNYTIELVCGTVEDGMYEFVRFAFDGAADFSDYIASQRAKSTFTSDVTVSSDDRIISMCTCSYEWDNARYMVIGVLRQAN